MSEAASTDSPKPQLGEDAERPLWQRIGLRRGLWIGAGLAVLAGFVLRATAPAPQPQAGDPDVGLSVQTVLVEPARVDHQVEVAGLVEARRRVELFAEEGGRVIEVGAEELDQVEAEGLLLRIDPLAAEVRVARSEAALARAESELELAGANLGRRRNLAKSRVSSESDLDEATSAQRVALATQRAAEADLREARDALAKRTLMAPFAGVLRSFPVEVGEYVSPGQRVAELLDVSHVRMEIGLRDRDVVAVRPGAPARVEIQALPGETFTGSVLRVAAASDPQTKKFPVQIEVANPEGRLLPGMVARVRLDLGEARLATLIPREAVLDEFGLAFVYLAEPGADEHTVARRRRVRVRDVPFQPTVLEVEAGLDRGDRIVTTQLRQLREGARLAVRESGVARAEERP
ncbi:MAG: efflux RND transporter periplasmic adaptor subunit [Proteobacteria bacterium]|nr:efflux RND transporter periplasmic adaptor subunit [Pseudomonadota bacterium]